MSSLPKVFLKNIFIKKLPDTYNNLSLWNNYKFEIYKIILNSGSKITFIAV